MSRVMLGFICIQGFPKCHDSAVKRNAFDLVLIRWMNLEPITQNKANQKEKDTISYINAYMWNLERWY